MKRTEQIKALEGEIERLREQGGPVAEWTAAEKRLKALRTAREDRIFQFITWAFLIAVALGMPTAWVVSSYFEAHAYNRATGSNVSTWDAMWIELRVQAGPK